MTPEKIALEAIARLVSLRHGLHVRLVSMTYQIQHPLGLVESVSLSGFPLRLEEQPVEETEETDGETPGGLAGEILSLLASVTRPTKGSVIAARLGKDYECSYVRGVLSRLKRKGLIDHYPDRGYWLRSRGAPTDETGTG